VIAQRKEAEESEEHDEANCDETRKKTAADGELGGRVEWADLSAAGKQHSESRQVK